MKKRYIDYITNERKPNVSLYDTLKDVMEMDKWSPAELAYLKKTMVHHECDLVDIIDLKKGICVFEEDV